jgi:hypothetical protein
MKREAAALGLLSLWWLVMVAAVGLGGDCPLNDDWAYGWSARHFAATGELRILDWAAPSLVLHIAWGAALVRLFGPSYVVLRAGTLGFALVGLGLLYGLGRASAWSRRKALLLALMVGSSPWWVNLSFTYMSDVPWLVLVLGAQLAVLGLRRWPQLGAFGAGLGLGAAALSRQFAMVMAPAFLLLLVLDARASGALNWRRLGARRAALFLAPLVLLYGPFHGWYQHVHGPTLAHRLTWGRMQPALLGLAIAHGLVVWLYVGLWAAPLVAGAAAQRMLRGLVSRRLGLWGGLLLCAFVVGAHVETYVFRGGRIGFDVGRAPTMPHLANVVYLLGAGPPTIQDVYQGLAPRLHGAPWLGYVLTVVSIGCGLVAAAWGGPVVRGLWSEARAVMKGEAEGGGETAPARYARLRTGVLLVGCAVLYLGWTLGTSSFVFDRYLLPVMPAALWLVWAGVPESVARSRLALALLALVAVFSLGATREYLAWTEARERAVRELEASGVPAADIDGGFEVNGPRHFAAFAARTGKLLGDSRSPWWVEGARYRVAFWPSTDGRCRTIRSYPFWTWPGSGDRAIHVLDCASPAK